MSKSKEPKAESRKRKADDKSAATKDKSSKKAKKEGKPSSEPATSAFALGSSNLDPTLSSLFSSATPAVINPALETRSRINASKVKAKEAQANESDDEDASVEDVADDASVSGSEEIGDEVDDEELSELDSDEMEAFDDDDDEEAEAVEEPAKRRRPKADEHDDLEAKYLKKLSKEAAKLEQTSKRTGGVEEAPEDEDAMDVDSDDAADAASDDEDMSPPPQHESLAPQGNEELEKAQNTVFLGNVSTTAITSKSDLKTLKTHLASFFPSLAEAAKEEPTRSVLSIRFRSTPFASAIPKRAAFARKEIMDATAHSTNAYAVYSSASLAREACKRLNGTVVLDRHLRVDSVAHPAKQDHKRCIFIGNLGFVDDETNIDAADPHKQHRGKKAPSDIEEGLWRTFSLCGTVESVRVVRDAKTRVGKGFAYVQFTDENAVEAALLNNDKKFPPMLPRKLRVTRAKAIKRNVTAAKRAREDQDQRKAKGGYVKKLTPQEQSQMGRAAKLLGKSAAGAMKRSGGAVPQGIKAPESFIFEGHRAKAGAKPAFKTKKGGQKAKPTKSGAKRGAAWKDKRSKD